MVLDTVEEDIIVVEVELEEDGSDILRDCAGGCGQKIFIFAGTVEDWGANVEVAHCLPCRVKLLTGSKK